MYWLDSNEANCCRIKELTTRGEVLANLIETSVPDMSDGEYKEFLEKVRKIVHSAKEGLYQAEKLVVSAVHKKEKLEAELESKVVELYDSVVTIVEFYKSTGLEDKAKGLLRNNIMMYNEIALKELSDNGFSSRGKIANEVAIRLSCYKDSL